MFNRTNYTINPNNNTITFTYSLTMPNQYFRTCTKQQYIDAISAIFDIAVNVNGMDDFAVTDKTFGELFSHRHDVTKAELFELARTIYCTILGFKNARTERTDDEVRAMFDFGEEEGE